MHLTSQWWRLAWLDDVVRETRVAVRVLRRSPGFAIVTVVSLAVGLALTASGASVVNAYLLRALPYDAAERVYHVRYAPPGPWEPRGMSGLDWRTVQDVVEFPITALADTFYLADGAYAQPARGLRVASGFVRGLGVRAATGRALGAPDFSTGAEPVAMIGYATWRDRYGSDPTVVGRLVRADTESRPGTLETFRVVGVLAPDFYFGIDSSFQVDVLLPLTGPARTYMARLREGVPPALAERRITEAVRAVASDLPTTWSGVHLESARERYVGGLRPVLVRVTAVVGLVLMIVCTNVAVLVLLRTMRRQKEIAVRSALGASRLQLARLLGVEVLLVAGAAFGIGIAATQIALRTLAPLIATRLGRPAPGGAGAIAIDGTVLLITGGIALLVSFSLSFLPLIAPWQRRLGEALRRDRLGSTDGLSLRRLRSGLIAFEVAGTLVLLVGGGLMMQSVMSMLRTDVGFEPGRLVRSGLALRGADYADDAAFFRFYDRFSESLSRAINAPVVFSTWPPFADRPTQSVEIDGLVGQGRTAGAVQVGGGYFGATGTALRSGRDFTTDDIRQQAPVAVVSETLAKRLWPDGQAVGRRIRAVEQTIATSTPGPWRTVVGVAADVRQAYGDAEVGDVYLPLATSSAGRYGSFYVRTELAPASVRETVRAVAAAIDPRAVVRETRAVVDENQQLIGARFLATVLAGFAGVALFLAAVGIYGVTAYTVQQREREIAIRMALGASERTILRLFLQECGLVLATGLALGLLGVALAGRVLQNQLYGVPAIDAATAASGCVLLAATGISAALWPARRAALKRPIAALKEG